MNIHKGARLMRLSRVEMALSAIEDVFPKLFAGPVTAHVGWLNGGSILRGVAYRGAAGHR
ncbi:hypothetical protein HNQ71_004596 [Mesorhizobium sangaii]|uniref:Uncharacterized protein n=1 Tax=Mesorhizobium sangaii TaxID=505389 RepID=A0A841PGX5_9HYPH|nr:hypothetical protein [Mesorhizobium sangaii]